MAAASLRRHVLLALAALALGLNAPALRAQVVAVPYYDAPAYTAALLAHGELPRALALQRESAALQQALQRLCEQRTDKTALAAAREQWRAATSAWDALYAVAVGPTVEQRSARSIDFWPARPQSIRRAIDSAPRDLQALERIGAPAKGLPALEWLLWPGEAARSESACRYAALLASDVAREADALVHGFSQQAGRDWKEEGEAASAFASEAINQWLGGLEQLRWRMLGKPLAAGRRDEFPRVASGSTTETWRAHWGTLSSLAVGPAPNDGFGPAPAVPPGVVTIEAYLRGRGNNPQADTWKRAVQRADRALQPLWRGKPQGLPGNAAMKSAVQALDALKRTLQAEVAPTLEVTLGFSDADGD